MRATRPAARLLFQLSLVLLALAATLGWAAAPSVVRHLARSEPAFYQRVALTAAVPVGSLAYRIDGMDIDWAPHFVEVLEDGRPLQAAPRRVVRSEGTGRYHLDRRSLLFAATDNSDPRHNGRRYELRRPRDIDSRLVRGIVLGFALVHALLLLSLAPRLVRGLVRQSGRGAILAATLAVAGFFVCLWTLERLLPEAPSDLLGEKLRQQRTIEGAIDTVFIGSSRVYRHLDPAELDRVFAEHGLPARSFNLGAPGMRMLEALYIAERLARRPNAPLRRLIVETESEPLLLEEENRMSSRAIRWHDRRNFQRIVGELHRTGDSLPGELVAVAQHLQPFLHRASHVGLGLELTAAATSPDHHFVSPERRGFFSLDDNLAHPYDEAQERDLREAYSTLHDQLPFYRRTIERLRQEPVAGRATDPFELELFRAMQALADEHGIALTFVLSPRPRRRPNLVHAYESGIIRQLVRFDDPDAYPGFYDPANRFDRHHLLGAYASEMTRRLAEILVETSGQGSDP